MVFRFGISVYIVVPSETITLYVYIGRDFNISNYLFLSSCRWKEVDDFCGHVMILGWIFPLEFVTVLGDQDVLFMLNLLKKRKLY